MSYWKWLSKYRFPHFVYLRITMMMEVRKREETDTVYCKLRTVQCQVPEAVQ